MEKNTKILLGVAAAGVVAYLVLKPKKAVLNTNVPTNDLDLDNLVRVKGERDSDVDPNLIKMANMGSSTQYTYNDKNGVIVMKYVSGVANGNIVTYRREDDVEGGGKNIYEYDRNGVFINKRFDSGIRY
jgi:hypothetical protein